MKKTVRFHRYMIVGGGVLGGFSMGYSFLDNVVQNDMPIVMNMFMFTLFTGLGAVLGVGFGAIYPISIPIACAFGFTRYREWKRRNELVKRHKKN